MYGSGLRLSEVIALRVKDVDLERRQIMIRRGKASAVLFSGRGAGTDAASPLGTVTAPAGSPPDASISRTSAFAGTGSPPAASCRRAISARHAAR